MELDNSNTSVKSCQVKSSCIIQNVMVSIVDGHDCVPDPNLTCQNFNCKANFFFGEIPNETQISRHFRNCMVIAEGEEIDPRDIGEMLGIAASEVSGIIHNGVMKLRRRARKVGITS